jgi:hypothetical protein
VPNVYPVFTDAEIATIVQEAQTVWNDVGYDCLDAMAKHGYARPRSIESVTMYRRDVIEIVLDADRLDSRLKGGIREKFDALTYNQKKTLVRRAFPHARYGL